MPEICCCCLTSCQFPVCCAAEIGTSQHTALCGPRREEGEFCILSDDIQADLTSVLMSHFCHVNTDFPVNMYFHINVTMNYLITALLILPVLSVNRNIVVMCVCVCVQS